MAGSATTATPSFARPETGWLPAMIVAPPPASTTALAMAEDLRHFLSHDAAMVAAAPRSLLSATSSGPPPGGTAYFLSGALKVVPKGLRSFSERDSDFFIELLPGPRNREGLPESQLYCGSAPFFAVETTLLSTVT